ncbi:MAG: phosphatase PAP2 family protein [Candidatus Pacearchaeota archaeon]
MIAKKIFQELTFLGGILFYLLFSGWFFIQKEYKLFFILISGLIIIYLATFLIRIFYFKNRPQKQDYKNLLERLDASSFPSVHSARISFIFIFMEYHFLSSVYLSLLFLILLSLVLYSRIYLKKHDLADVIAGVILGTLTSLIFLLSW